MCSGTSGKRLFSTVLVSKAVSLHPIFQTLKSEFKCILMFRPGSYPQKQKLKLAPSQCEEQERVQESYWSSTWTKAMLVLSSSNPVFYKMGSCRPTPKNTFTTNSSPYSDQVWKQHCFVLLRSLVLPEEDTAPQQNSNHHLYSCYRQSSAFQTNAPVHIRS